MKSDEQAGEDRAIPRHLGLILDGNRRWATANGMPKLQGHKKGYENLKIIAEEALEQGVEYLSAYIFSTENWNRAKDEVGYLMKLVIEVFTNDIDSFIEKDVKIVFLGSKKGLSKSVLAAMQNAESRTEGNTRGTLALCFNYGGHAEIVDAVKAVVTSGAAADDIDEAVIQQHLYRPDVPPVDFMIRTSGEQRLSNFMLWRMSYAELYFTEKHWPAFGVDDLRSALDEYASRQRRFGK